jgi:chromosome condensin MukBEF MukE localization factor
MPRPAGKEGHAVDGLGQAQVVEHAEDVGAQLDAGADFTEARRLLQQGHAMTVLGQHHGRGQPADAAARDEEREWGCLCHM